MKKISIALLLSLTLAFAVFQPQPASAKVMWDGIELKKGQIGKLTVLKKTELYKLEGNKETFSRTLKPGEVYRIYTFLPGRLGLGGGYYIDRDSRIKYQTPSKEKLQALGIKITENKYEGQDRFKYPQVSGLISKSVEKTINDTFKRHIMAAKQNYLVLKGEQEAFREEYLKEHGSIPADMEYMFKYEYGVTYDVKYNENNLLSIMVYDYQYSGGAHGLEAVYAYNFNILNGQEQYLTNVAKSQAAMNKIKKYAITDMTNRAKRGEDFFVEYLGDLQINNNTAFYFTPTGIVLKFQEYEVSSYASGKPEVKVPYKAFK